MPTILQHVRYKSVCHGKGGMIFWELKQGVIFWESKGGGDFLGIKMVSCIYGKTKQNPKVYRGVRPSVEHRA